MSEDVNMGEGRIAGFPQDEDRSAQDGSRSAGRIAGEAGASSTVGGRIAGDAGSSSAVGGMTAEETAPKKPQSVQQAGTRRQRIAQSTSEGGLRSLPPNFGDSNGDWQIITSDNLFELFYLDYEQADRINPDMVVNNFNLLEAFWKEKREFWDSGSGQIRESIEGKYGTKNLSGGINRLRSTVSQLSTQELISAYDEKLRGQRIQRAGIKLEPMLKIVTKNGEVEQGEVEAIIEEGLQYEVNIEEIAVIIKKVIYEKGFKPYGTPSGGTLSEQLLSVSWMTDELLAQRMAEDQAKKKAGREIMEGIYAYSTEEIGEIIFNHEAEAKRDIADGLLKNSIDYFSTAKARQFVEIVNTQKNEHLRYLQVVYRLKPQLPYRLSHNRLAQSPGELCNMMFETPDNFRLGKDQFKKGYPEVWFLETNKPAFDKVAVIRGHAENADLAFLEFLYTFSPQLPYRFAGSLLVRSSQELCKAIDQNAQTWESGKTELFDNSFVVWLSTIGQKQVVQDWLKVKEQFVSQQEIGLEFFLHILSRDLLYSQPAVDKQKIEFPKIQSGQVIKVVLNISNTTRGCMDVRLSFSKVLPGVQLATEHFIINSTAGQPQYNVELVIDSNMLLKGVDYTTSIIVTTFEMKKIEIPLNFRIVFPRNAFFRSMLIYAAITGSFFALLRMLLATRYPDWLNKHFTGYISWDPGILFSRQLAIFGWTLLVLAGVLTGGVILLCKFLKKKR